jgi:molecular chaperone HtpG
MAQHIQFPERLKQLLQGSKYEAAVRDLAARVGEILADNKTTFFPDYTDHGVAHINDVLASEVQLIPEEVWNTTQPGTSKPLLTDADAAVIIGATLLHDLGMHLHPQGFRELIGHDSRFRPLPWFDSKQEGYWGDRPWADLWEDYAREARRFSGKQLANIIGEDAAKDWRFDALPASEGEWTLNHRLIVGEFIRRHHARLAHEIAMNGFPGLEPGEATHQFPAIARKGHALETLADLIGVTARSHGISLRVCTAYLEKKHSFRKTPRPKGTAVLYPMALLRVADYLQLDKSRAPAVLLQLHDPQSPISIDEWRKHDSVRHIGDTNDPHGVHFDVSADISLSLYLQLEELLTGLQREMDQSTAVLAEYYGNQTRLELDRLVLAKRRIDSNLQSPEFRDSLPYLPQRSGFSADPQLLTLLVEPLYGKHPSVGVRELMQNAVDAVRELEEWCKKPGRSKESLDLPALEADVLVEFIRQDDTTWLLRVTDRGIGMRGETLANYFLRAGASFRQSTEWTSEFVDGTGKPTVTRAGQFGIGAFAIFLLGEKFKLWTRHAGAGVDEGYSLGASITSTLIEVQKDVESKVGTKIEVMLRNATVEYLGLNNLNTLSARKALRRLLTWYCWDELKIAVKVNSTSATPHSLKFNRTPIMNWPRFPEWSMLETAGSTKVFWSFNRSSAPPFSYNGFRIGKPIVNREADAFDNRINIGWPQNFEFKQPVLAIDDPNSLVRLTANRFSLQDRQIPFLSEVVDDILHSFIAYCLICGPQTPNEAWTKRMWHPLQQEPTVFRNNLDVTLFEKRYIRWCITPKAFVPDDPRIYPFLDASKCVIYGVLWDDEPDYSKAFRFLFKTVASRTSVSTAGIAVDDVITYASIDGSLKERYLEDSAIQLAAFLKRGIPILGGTKVQNIIASISEKHIKTFEKTTWAKSKVAKSFQGWTINERHYADRLMVVPAKSTNEPQMLQPELEALEQSFAELTRSRRRGRAKADSDRRYCGIPIFFVAVLDPIVADGTWSRLAQLWTKLLGAKPIPFDTDARAELISKAGIHPEIKRHLAVWTKMKQMDSKWATGNFTRHECGAE